MNSVLLYLLCMRFWSISFGKLLLSAIALYTSAFKPVSKQFQIGLGQLCKMPLKWFPAFCNEVVWPNQLATLVAQ